MPTCSRAWSGPPVLVNKFVDYDLPKLYSTWKPSIGPRGIVRPLMPSERAAIQERISEIAIGTSPYLAEEEGAVSRAIMVMLNGFRTQQRLDNDQAAIMVNSIKHLLAPFPFWAIEQGCSLIHANKAEIEDEKGERKKLSRNYAPHDPEIYAVIDNIVQPYRDMLARSQALLAAPLDGK